MSGREGGNDDCEMLGVVRKGALGRCTLSHFRSGDQITPGNRGRMSHDRMLRSYIGASWETAYFNSGEGD